MCSQDTCLLMLMSSRNESNNHLRIELIVKFWDQTPLGLATMCVLELHNNREVT